MRDRIEEGDREREKRNLLLYKLNTIISKKEDEGKRRVIHNDVIHIRCMGDDETWG